MDVDRLSQEAQGLFEALPLDDKLSALRVLRWFAGGRPSFVPNDETSQESIVTYLTEPAHVSR
jgi:hypothetical protein